MLNMKFSKHWWCLKLFYFGMTQQVNNSVIEHDISLSLAVCLLFLGNCSGICVGTKHVRQDAADMPQW